VSNLADLIEEYILDLLRASAELHIQRSNLATEFRCAPSQISYVLETRFTPARGFRVESRRGGGGFIRITKIQIDPDSCVSVVASRAGNVLDARNAEHYIGYLHEQGAITAREARIMIIALANVVHVDPRVRDALRAEVFQQMLFALVAKQHD